MLILTKTLPPYSTTSSTASSCDTEFSREDEQRLRDYIQQLKNDRAAVRLTVMELESVHVDPMSQESTPSGDSQRLDLENAVLMQELTALKVSEDGMLMRDSVRRDNGERRGEVVDKFGDGLDEGWW